MKKSYTSPNLRIDMFRSENIITTSGGNDQTHSLADDMKKNGSVTSVKEMTFADFKSMIVL